MHASDFTHTIGIALASTDEHIRVRLALSVVDLAPAAPLSRLVQPHHNAIHAIGVGAHGDVRREGGGAVVVVVDFGACGVVGHGCPDIV